MFKRIVSNLMVLGIIVCMIAAFPVGKVSANEVTNEIQDVTVEVIEENQNVKIQGNISSGIGNEVTITITNSVDDIDYLNQQTSQEDGNFSFTYVPSSTWDGEYMLRIGGEGVSSPYEDIFQIGDDDQDDQDGEDGHQDGQDDQDDEDGQDGKDDQDDEDGQDGQDDQDGKDGQDGQDDKNGQLGNKQNASSDDNGDKELPKTATNTFNYVIMGFVLLVAGSLAILFARKRKLNK